MDHIDLSQEENYVEPNEVVDSVEVDQHADSTKGKKGAKRSDVWDHFKLHDEKAACIYLGNFINIVTKMRGLVHCETILSVYARNIHIGFQRKSKRLWVITLNLKMMMF